MLSLPRVLILATIALPACSASAPPPPPAPTAPAVDEAAARKAVEVGLAYLGKRNFEVGECAAAAARVAPEAEARAGMPVGDRCGVMVARRADGTWLVTVRPATRGAPSRAGGSLAVVTVTAGGEGVTHIDYVR
jgi:hypothetical protein